jgi:nitrogen fixation NifU-like protein
MSDPLYRKELLRLAADAHGAGRLAASNVTGAAFNPACGDRVTVGLALADGRISAMAHDTKACVLAQASASILGQSLKGSTRADIESLRTAVTAMLESGGAPPIKPFESYAVFDGAVEYRSRHRCVLLPIEAVLNAFEELDSRQTGGIRTKA